MFYSIPFSTAQYSSGLLCCGQNKTIWFYSAAFCCVLLCLLRLILFCFVPYGSVLLHSVVFCSILFHYILFCCILLSSVLLCTVLFCSIPFHSVLQHSVVLCSALNCSVMFHSALFCCILFWCILMSSVLLSYLPFCSWRQRFCHLMISVTNTYCILVQDTGCVWNRKQLPWFLVALTV